MADVVLFGMAARLALKAGGLSGFLETTLCVVAVALGAWLAWLALGMAE